MTFENRFSSKSDSGVHVLDPQDRALLRACANAWNSDDDADAHRRFLKAARELPAVRLERVMRIRRAIANGTYLTDDKLRATVDRLLGLLDD